MFTKKIKSIKKIGKMQTYDLHTPKHHNFFLANGILSHNSGKSYSALSEADIICERGLDVARCLAFDATQFMEKIVNKDILQKGDIMIFDEAGVGMSSREWYSVQNKLLGSVLQTFRNLNIGVIFTTPNLGFIDVQARKLFHNYFETVYIDTRESKAYLSVYDIQHNSRYDKTFYKRPKIMNNYGRQETLKYIGVPKPRPEIIKEYERLKGEYTTKLNERVLKELTKEKISNMDKNHREDIQIKDTIIKNPEEFIKRRAGREFIDEHLISAKYGVGSKRNQKIRAMVEQEMGF